jgi:hypothetical protein
MGKTGRDWLPNPNQSRLEMTKRMVGSGVCMGPAKIIVNPNLPPSTKANSNFPNYSTLQCDKVRLSRTPSDEMYSVSFELICASLFVNVYEL